MSEGFLNAVEALLRSIRDKLIQDVYEYDVQLNKIPANASDQEVIGLSQELTQNYILPGIKARRALSQIELIREALAHDEVEAHALPLTTKSTLVSRLMVIEDDQTNPEREYTDINKLFAWAEDHGIEVPEAEESNHNPDGDFESEADLAGSALPEAAIDEDEDVSLDEALHKMRKPNEHAEGTT